MRTQILAIKGGEVGPLTTKSSGFNYGYGKKKIKFDKEFVQKYTHIRPSPLSHAHLYNIPYI